MSAGAAAPIEQAVAREGFAARRRSVGGRELIDSRGTGIALGELTAADRPRIAEILRSSRVFSADEVGVALEVFDQAIAEYGLRIASEPHRPETALRNPQSSYFLLGAFTPERILVGYVCWGPTPATDRTFDLYWIAVDPSLHGAGIGTILMEEVERRLAREHARLIIVETSSRADYAATRAFYQRRGYSEAARLRDFYAPGDDRIIFIKRFHTHLPRGEEQGRDE